ncbi:MAG: response regulator [Verrucomicrobia bacterium]|nr:response regulator [Verrucomicrobiota bacterium]
MKADYKKTVLLVDDDKHLLLTMSDFLRFEEFVVVTATSGEDALRVVAKSPPDIIVLDISMPGIGGVGFFRRMNEDDSLPKVPILVLTARDSMEEFFVGMNADGFMTKPCSGAELAREIRAILTRRAAGQRRSRGSRGTILLVEDDADMSERLCHAIARAGYEVEAVDQALQIFKVATSKRPDLIAIKEALRTTRGSTVAMMARGHRITEKIPIILYDGTRDLMERKRQGEDDPEGVDLVVHTDSSSAIVDAIDALIKTSS